MCKKSIKESIFYITNDLYVEKFKTYLTTFPKDQRTGRLFRKMRFGKTKKMAIGIHKVAKVPRKVARFLGKDQPELYTGHAFRRTGAKVLTEAG